MNSGTARSRPAACARLATAAAAPGSIIAAIIASHRAMKNANEPSRVVTPMSMPSICPTATTQAAAASPSVATTAAGRSLAGSRTAFMTGRTRPTAMLGLRFSLRPPDQVRTVRVPRKSGG